MIMMMIIMIIKNSVFTGILFAAVVANMLLVTVLTLPAILSSTKMSSDIFHQE